MMKIKWRKREILKKLPTYLKVWSRQTLVGLIKKFCVSSQQQRKVCRLFITTSKETFHWCISYLALKECRKSKEKETLKKEKYLLMNHMILIKRLKRASIKKWKSIWWIARNLKSKNKGFFLLKNLISYLGKMFIKTLRVSFKIF